jgi:hypothetical protein
MLKNKIYIIFGSSVLVVGFLLGSLVPLETKVMRCSSDAGKTFDIIVRLDNFLIGESKFYTRQEGVWLSGNRSTDKGFYKTTTTSDAATKKDFTKKPAFTARIAKTLGVDLNENVFNVSTVVYDFVSLTRKGVDGYFTTLDFKARDEGYGLRFRQRCRLD